MIEFIIIKKLFNLYDYRIIVQTLGQNRIHFITAPNGYGKTTILKMISTALQGNFEGLLEIPFQEFELVWDNDTHLSVIRTEIYPKQEENSDQYLQPEISLSVILRFDLNFVGRIIIKSGSFTPAFSDTFENNDNDGNIRMFLQSLSCDYITDSRILEKKTDVGNDRYKLDTMNIMDYSKRVKNILNDPIESAQYKDRLVFFKNIVDDLVFSSKKIEVAPAYGFRFSARDKNKTIIPLERLSSGEKHILVQLCELLFVAKEGTLVLIDEPEISLHMAWQYQYLKILEGIASLCGFQLIIATHSPQIFNEDWNRVTDLFEISHKNG